MKVLITGGYGFIGSHVAERFFKEGYEVYIIDNLSTGKKENVSFKHKGYILSVEDEKCEEIFKSYDIDVVVHLAAQVSVAKSIVNPREDTSTNAVGLVNILMLAHKYQVKKFIFASSAAVYGTNKNIPLVEEEPYMPISPYGISKWMGESYCQKWKELHNFDSVCFRFSNVYGPRQSNEGEGGVVSIFMDHILQEKTLQIFGDGDQTRDFIYVADIADAIYRAAHSTLHGIFNLSTNTEFSVNELISSLKDIHDGEVMVNYNAARDGDIYRSVLNNQKVKDSLDWSPMYAMHDGLKQTYEWARAKQTKEKTVAIEKTRKKPLPDFVKTIKPYLENVAVFLVISWLVMMNHLFNLNSTDLSIFYIVLIGVIYGNRQSIIAVGLSVGLLVTEKLANGREFVSLLYDTNFFFQIALFLFVGLVVGYSIQRKSNLITEQKSKIDELDDRYEFLNGVYSEVREVKDELQLRLLNSGDSFGKIHAIIKELDDLEPEKVFTNTVNVVQTIMNAKNVSIYIFNKNQSFLRLVASSNTENSPITNSIKVAESPFIQQILFSKKVFVNKTLQLDSPLMAAPLYHNGQISAVITINGLEFENLSIYHENLFKVITELVQSALVRALNYIKITENDRYVPYTHILKRDIFNEILTSKKEAKARYQTPFVLLRVACDGHLIEDVARKLGHLLRETDYIGQTESEEILVLLSNTSEADVTTVLTRFNQAGIQLLPLHGNQSGIELKSIGVGLLE